jgi:adenine-specific DNA-methyltransferase
MSVFSTLRAQLGLSEQDVCELLSLSPDAVRAYDDGSGIPSVQEIQAMKGLVAGTRSDSSYALDIAACGLSPNLPKGVSNSANRASAHLRRKRQRNANPLVMAGDSVRESELSHDGNIQPTTSDRMESNAFAVTGVKIVKAGAATRYKIVTAEKAGGATYTPKKLADFVSAQILSKANLGETEGALRVLDPAVGDGELLVSLLHLLRKRTHRTISVYGFDINPNALSEARSRIGGIYPDSNIYLEKGNFLEFVANQSHSNLSLFERRDPAYFDLIIANPPYVRTQIMGAQQAQSLAMAFGLTGRVDLYHAFLIGMASVLRPGGTAGIIVSNRFMTTRGGASVRRALREQLSLEHIWDLGDTKLFEAAVLPAVIVARAPSGERNLETRFTSIYSSDGEASHKASDAIEALNSDGVVRLNDGRLFRVTHGKLDTKGSKDLIWRCVNADSDAWMETVSKNTWATFRDIGKVRVGVKTCADSVFIRSDWSKLPVDEQPELLRPVITHHIGRRYRATAIQKQILYPHESAEGRRRTIDLATFPKSRKYLDTFRNDLEARSYVIEAGRAWYEIWVPQDPAAWLAPKLVFRDIAEEPTFWVDLEGSVVNGDCYWLTAERPQSEHLIWLAVAVANSKFVESFYDHRFNNKLYAGRRRFITQYVEQFPLPDPEREEAREIVELSRAIYAEPNSSAAVTNAKRIETLVWTVFGLGVEEVTR